MNMVAKILVIIGGVNWGLVGLGMLLNSMTDWNVVKMLLGSMPVVEAIVYLLVGIASVMIIFGCKCSKCAVDDSIPENRMGEGMGMKEGM